MYLGAEVRKKLNFWQQAKNVKLKFDSDLLQALKRESLIALGSKQKGL